MQRARKTGKHRAVQGNPSSSSLIAEPGAPAAAITIGAASASAAAAAAAAAFLETAGALTHFATQVATAPVADAAPCPQGCRCCE